VNGEQIEDISTNIEKKETGAYDIELKGVDKRGKKRRLEKTHP